MGSQARPSGQTSFPMTVTESCASPTLLLQGSTEASAIKEHVLKYTLPLVGHRKASNDAKRYSRRPLVVVYYGVDFSFDYRAGEAGWALGRDVDLRAPGSPHSPALLPARAGGAPRGEAARQTPEPRLWAGRASHYDLS